MPSSPSASQHGRARVGACASVSAVRPRGPRNRQPALPAGAFVAGLDAGHAYNTFPTMNGRWVPDEYWAVPGWRNAFQSTAAVQLHHRGLALSTLGAVAGLWAAHARGPLPPPARACLTYLLAATCAQVRSITPRIPDASSFRPLTRLTISRCLAATACPCAPASLPGNWVAMVLCPSSLLPVFSSGDSPDVGLSYAAECAHRAAVRQ